MIGSVISSLRVVSLHAFRHCSHTPDRIHNCDGHISTLSATVCVVDKIFL